MKAHKVSVLVTERNKQRMDADGMETKRQLAETQHYVCLSMRVCAEEKKISD